MPSEREGLSFAVIEAMGSGLAIVVSDGPGNPEAIGDAGIVVAVGDVEALAATLGELARDPAQLRRLGSPHAGASCRPSPPTACAPASRRIPRRAGRALSRRVSPWSLQEGTFPRELRLAPAYASTTRSSDASSDSRGALR